MLVYKTRVSASDLDGAARTTITAGAGYKAKRWKADLGFGVILEGSPDNPGTCNPVEKDDRKRLHPEAHLLCYWIEGEKAPPQVRVANQLHPNQLLWLRKAALICAPTGKEEVKEGKPPNPEPPKIPAGLDHFKCYPQRLEGMQPPALRRQHNFTDQFRSYVLVNFSARFLCNPAAKYRWGRLETPVLHDFAHLVCYVTYPQVTQNRRVRIANQFERDATLDVLFLQMACFPSTKMVRR